jgi:hypothetical protein
LRLIGEALKASRGERPAANDQPMFGSQFEAVTALARHSLSQAVRRVVADNGLGCSSQGLFRWDEGCQDCKRYFVLSIASARKSKFREGLIYQVEIIRNECFGEMLRSVV